MDYGLCLCGSNVAALHLRVLMEIGLKYACLIGYYINNVNIVLRIV